MKKILTILLILLSVSIYGQNKFTSPVEFLKWVKVDENLYLPARGYLNASPLADSMIASYGYVKTHGGSSQWLNNGSKIYYNLGNVGINTNNPVYKLDVNGSINGTSYYLGGVQKQFSQWTQANGWLYYSIVSPDSVFLVGDVANATNPFVINKALKRIMLDDSNSGYKVGIGKSPSYKLDVNGDVNIASGSHFKINGVNLSTGGTAGYRIGISGTSINNRSYWNTQDSLKTTLSGLVKSTAGKLTAITDNSNLWNTALQPSTAATLSSLAINGTSGNGYLNLQTQSSPPSTPSSGIVLYANSVNKFTWKGQNGYQRVFDGAQNTSDRTYKLPNYNYTLDSITTTSKTAGIGYLKGNGSVISFDNTTYNSGSGTSNYITKWTGTNVIANSGLQDNGTNVSVGSVSAGQNVTIYGTEGTEINPPLTGENGVNWTFSDVSGYSLPLAGTIAKTGDGTGSFTPTGAGATMNIGTYYKCVIVVASLSGGIIYVRNNSYFNISAAGTYTSYFYASLSSKINFIMSETGIRFILSSISIKPITLGNLEVHGDLKLAGGFKDAFGNTILSYTKDFGIVTDALITSTASIKSNGFSSAEGILVNGYNYFDSNAGGVGQSYGARISTKVDASAFSPEQDCPFLGFSSNAWNTTPTASSKQNVMGIRMRANTGATTSGRLVFENNKVDGNSNTNELMGLTSGGNLGIGIATPTNKLHIDSGTGAASNLQFTANATTGQTATDGTLFGIDASGNAVIKQQENLPFYLYTNGTLATTVDASQNLTQVGMVQGSNIKTNVTTHTTSIGIGAGNQENTSAARYNTNIGINAGYYNNTGQNNICIGPGAGFSNTVDANTYIGAQAGGSSTTGIYNMFLGYFSGLGNKTGSYNTYIGAQAGISNKYGTNNVYIGNSAGFFGVNESNQLIIDNQSRADSAAQKTSALIYGTFNSIMANQKLRVNGDFTYLLKHALLTADSISYTPTIARYHWKNIRPGMTTIENNGFTVAGDSIKILTAGDYRLDFNISLSGASAGDYFVIRVYKNNVRQTVFSRLLIQIGSNNGNATRTYFWYLRSLAVNDYLTLRITNITASRNPTITDEKILISKVPE